MSKKDEALRLFGEGKRPSDPEVKALGLRAKTRYNYYQEYKKSLEIDDSEVSEIQELKQERVRLTLLSQIEDLEAKRERLPDRVGRLERQVRQIAKWLDENKFENHELILFIIDTLVAVRTGKTLDKDLVEGMMEDAQKHAITSERENGKYIDKIEGI